jgi:hypothetical protein
VLLCNWDLAGKLACKVEDGFLFDFNVGSNLTVRIPKATKQKEGLYVCQLVPSDGIPTNTCTLRKVVGK